MRIRWTPKAAADLESVYRYLEEKQPLLARSTIVELRHVIRKLKQFPNMGRRGREEGTRELLRGRLPHVVVYQVQVDIVEILHVWHLSQDRH